MKDKIIKWLELDEWPWFEFNRNTLRRFFRMIPVILGSIYIYVMLTSVGEASEPHSAIWQIGTLVAPVVCYATWALAVFFIFAKPRSKTGDKEENPEGKRE